jgi:hypothetical protein
MSRALERTYQHARRSGRKSPQSRRSAARAHHAARSERALAIIRPALGVALAGDAVSDDEQLHGGSHRLSA